MWRGRSRLTHLLGADFMKEIGGQTVAEWQANIEAKTVKFYGRVSIPGKSYFYKPILKVDVDYKMGFPAYRLLEPEPVIVSFIITHRSKRVRIW